MSRLSLLAIAGVGLWGVGLTCRAESGGPALAEAPLDASASELMEFLQTEPQLSGKPASRDQQFQFHRKASWARVRAANRLLKIGRQESHFMAALQAKRHYLGVLGQLGEKKCRDESNCLFHTMSAHDNPTLAATARRLAAYERLNCWRELRAEEKESVASEARALLEQAPGSIENVRLASNIANVAGSSGDAPLAIELLDYMLPTLSDAADQQVRELAPKVEGLSRRLRLPGNRMELEGQTIEGGAIDWESFRGKVVLVDFWATWCGPCVAELPNVRRCYDKHHDQGFDVVAVSLDESPQLVRKFIEQHQVPWTVLCGASDADSGWNHPMAVRYGIRRLPQAILVDQEGKVVHMDASGERLEPLLEKLLSDPVADATSPSGEAVARQ